MQEKSETYPESGIGRSFRWLRFIFTGGVILILLLAFFSYTPSDSAALSGGISSSCRNYVGVLGAVFSRTLFLFCGVAAYLAVVLAVLHLLRSFFPGKISCKLFWSGWLLLVFGAMLLLALDPAPFADVCDWLGLGRKSVPESALSGGVIGQVLAAPELPAHDIPAGIMRQLIGSGGVMICGWVLTLCGAILIFFGDLITFPWKLVFAGKSRGKDDYPEIREVKMSDHNGKEKTVNPDLPDLPEPQPQNGQNKYVDPDFPEIADIRPERPAAKPLVADRDDEIVRRPAGRNVAMKTPEVGIHEIASGEKPVSGSRE